MANSLCVELSPQCKHNDREGHSSQVITTADERGEEHGVGGRPEDVPMYLFPAVLIPKVTLLATDTATKEDFPADEF